MATNAIKTDVKTTAVKKPAPTTVQRVNDILKRAALQGKVTSDELDNVAALAGSLKVFLQS